MPVTPDEIRRVADLAALQLTPEVEDELMRRIDRIIAYTDMLQEVDTEGVEPLIHPFAGSSAPLRPDEARKGLGPEEALANAPDRHGSFFKVPRMIEEARDD